MKIAILSTLFLKHNGGDRVNKDLAEKLAKEGNDVTVYTFDGDMSSDKVRIKTICEYSNVHLRSLHLLLFFLDVIGLYRLVREMKAYDRIIAFHYPMTLAGFLARLFYGKRFECFDNGTAYANTQNRIINKTYYVLYNFLNFELLKRADCVTTISQFLKYELKNKHNVNARVLKGGPIIDRKKFNRTFNKKPVSKKHVKIIVKKHNLTKPILLYVGRVNSQKGTHLLLKSFGLVKEKIPKASLIIVGKRTPEKVYSRLLNKLSQGEVYTGYVTDKELPYYYHACDLFVTASQWEGYNLPAAEAQACGRKVVAFDVGSHREVVRNGMLVKEGDVKAFAEAVIKILKEQEIRKRRKGQTC